MNCFSSSLVRTANEGLGVIFQGAMVGFDIYELANAQNETQRAVFGTNLAFDSSSLGLGIVSTGASLTWCGNGSWCSLGH
ncbi:TcdA/TcdB pore-forming domain-containing protein [Providencia hangzhouensis]|uniref:TcdA/TcdB pore-forming domain-containing protein n=1 Tax=Providencia hangzhouensis TaxID=3031799 RepID=UPI0034DD9092